MLPILEWIIIVLLHFAFRLRWLWVQITLNIDNVLLNIWCVDVEANEEGFFVI